MGIINFAIKSRFLKKSRELVSITDPRSSAIGKSKSSISALESGGS
jgi:hypothetical protein